jgi:OOP family OmpA-OmpF porin
MRTFLAALVALIALCVLAYFCISSHAPVIANDLSTRSEMALREGGVAFATVDGVNGRDVTLTGEAPDAAAKAAAVAAVDKVWGVRTVVDKMSIAAPAPPAETPYRFQAVYGANTLTLTGTVPNAEVRAALIAAAGQKMPGVRIDDQLTLRADPPGGAIWPSVLERGFAMLARFAEGSLQIEGTTVALQGVAPTQAAYDAVSRDMQMMPAEFTAQFTGSVAAPPPPAEPAPGTPPVPQPKPEPTPEPEAAQARDCQRDFNAAFKGQTINFASASAVIAGSSRGLLRRLAGIAGKCPKANFFIDGHTDNVGPPAANLKLSRARAEAVKAEMARQGVARQRMTARGFGETRPVGNNKTERGRAANRRIVFVVR